KWLAQVWNAESGTRILDLSGLASSVDLIRFSSDGRWILTVSFGSTARLWDGRTGRNLATLGDVADPVWDAIFLPGINEIATTDENGEVRVWDIALWADTHQ